MAIYCCYPSLACVPSIYPGYLNAVQPNRVNLLNIYSTSKRSSLYSDEGRKAAPRFQIPRFHHHLHPCTYHDTQCSLDYPESSHG